MFVIEAMRAGIGSNADGVLLTPTMRAVLRSRLDQLPDRARGLAEVAAVIGRPFTIDLLSVAAGVEESALVDDVDVLWRRRIFRDEGHTYDFSHDKLRAVTLELLSPARRRQLHREVAAAISATSGTDARFVGPRLAAHYDQGGLTAPAVEAYLRSGRRAVEVSAIADATSMFQRALVLLADIPPSDERDSLELEIRIALGAALVAVEGYGSSEARQLYERAMSLSRRLHREVDPPILRGLGLAAVMHCDFDEATARGRALVEHASNDRVARTEGLYLLGVSSFWRGDLAGARRHLAEATETYDVSDRRLHLASYAQDPQVVCRVRLALAELWAGDVGAARSLSRASRHRSDRARSPGDPRLRRGVRRSHRRGARRPRPPRGAGRPQ